MEKIIEHFLFASRWILAPFYIGLIGTLIILLISFAKELIHLFVNISTLQASDAILGCLSLIDISLAANLVIIVVFSGYENFVSKIDVAEHADNPSWKSKVDFTGLKIKLVTSIVAISGIHLLKVFVDINKYDPKHIEWMVIIHIVFVISGVMLALMDHLIVRSKAFVDKN
jgi:uncharacterized protein (TIGR00645 family)